MKIDVYPQGMTIVYNFDWTRESRRDFVAVMQDFLEKH